MMGLRCGNVCAQFAEAILDHLGDGCSVDDIREKYPELIREQIVAAIRHCHDLIERTDLEPA